MCCMLIEKQLMYTRYTDCLRGYEIYSLVDHTMDNITTY